MVSTTAGEYRLIVDGETDGAYQIIRRRFQKLEIHDTFLRAGRYPGPHLTLFCACQCQELERLTQLEMEQLDTKTHPENCKYITIGGKCSKLHRMPSSLQMQSSERCRGYGGRRFSQDTNGSLSRPNSCNSSVGSGVFRWKESDVAEWLKESGFEQYEVNTIIGTKLI